MKKGITSPLVLCYLKKVGVVAALDKEGKKELEQHSKVRVLRHKKGWAVEFPLENENSVYILQEGQAFLSCLAPSGRKIILDTLKEGDIFGDLGVKSDLKDEECLFVEPERKIVICEIPKTFFSKLIENQPYFAAQLVLSLNKKVNQLAKQVGNLLFADARTKLLLLLARLAAQGYEERDLTTIPQKLTHQQLADMIGVQRPTLSSLISELIKEGVIRYKLGHFLQVSKQKLSSKLTV